MVLSHPALLHSDAVQRLLQIFYAIFDTGFENILNATSFYEFARLAFAVEWALVPAQVLFFLVVFKRDSVSHLASMALWKSFLLVHFIGLVIVASYVWPFFQPPLKSLELFSDSIGTHVAHLAYGGKLGFLLVFSIMGWIVGLTVAICLSYWRWVIYPRFFGGKDERV